MSVPPKYYRYFVTRNAETINQICAEYQRINVTFPKTNSKNSRVLIKGCKDNVHDLKNKINNIVQKLVICFLKL